MKKITRILPVCSLALILVSGDLPAKRLDRSDVHALQSGGKTASGPNHCSTKTLKGTYSYTVNGTYDGVPFAESGLETYDGKGKLIGLGSDSSDPSNSSFRGVYSLNADCTGTVDYGDSGVYNIYVKPDGSGFTFLDKTPGRVLASEERRIYRKLMLK